MSSQPVATAEERLLAMEQGLESTCNRFVELQNTFQDLLTRFDSIIPKSPNPTNPTSPIPIVEDLPMEQEPQPQPKQTTEKTPRLRPASPSDYDGDRSKGRVFQTSFTLYISLCPEQFADYRKQIHWVMSFMKSGRAALWAHRILREEKLSGRPFFATWKQFLTGYEEYFTPPHAVETALTRLESTLYFQRTRSVDDYIDEFQDLILEAGYSDGLAIVMKFRRGLDVRIQNRIAEMGAGKPANNDPHAWFETARLFDQNRAANEAFQFSAGRQTIPKAPAADTPFRPVPNFARVFAPKPPAPQAAAPIPQGIPMDVDAFRRKSATPSTCFRCGKVGHMARECLQAFDIRYMTDEDKQRFIEQLLSSADVAAVETRAEASGEEADEESGFQQRNE